jgi:uncharacterized Zn finger protein (UPF0148 family)
VANINCAKCGQSLTPQEADVPCPQCGSLDRKNAVSDQAVVLEAAKKDEAARELANKHYQLEAGLTQIVRFSGKAEVEVLPAEPIKLLEVNEATVTSGVRPLHFGPVPASGIPYPSVIIEVTPTEFEQIKRQELKLPEGWITAEALPNPNGHGGCN